MASVTVATFTSAGKTSQHVIPGAYSRLDVLAGASGFVSIGNVVLFGSAQGGEPQKLLQFNNQSQALNTLKGGPLYDAIRHAFNPSPDPDQTPQRLFAMRVNNASRSSYGLEAGGADVITLRSRDWGTDQNTIQVRTVAAGVAALYGGLNIELNFGGEDEVFENAERGILTIQTSDAGNTIQVTADSIIIDDADGTVNERTIRYVDYDNVAALVADLARFSELTVTVTNALSSLIRFTISRVFAVRFCDAVWKSTAAK